MTRRHVRRLLPLLVVTTLAATVLAAPLASAPRAAAQQPAFVGEVPTPGTFGLVTWSGGTLDALDEAAGGKGCAARSVWTSGDGGLLGYLFAAPAFVNRAFTERHPGLALPEGTPVILVCEPAAPSSGGPSGAAWRRGEPSCPVFPASNPWNTDISEYPVHPRSAEWVASIGLGGHLHPDFGTVWQGNPIGIPYVVLEGDVPGVSVSFDYADESDPGPYPIPADVPIEAGSDAHVLVVDDRTCTLYELFAADQRSATSWHAGSGAIFDLGSNGLRPDSWTSADAAGLPIFPGLVRYDEVASGVIDHALRFTASRTQRAYIHPATHWASSVEDPSEPPMGARLRLRADYDCSPYSREIQVVCAALKRYGMLLADNGSDWYVSGAPDSRWDDDALRDLRSIPGSAFDVVDTGERLHTPSAP